MFQAETALESLLTMKSQLLSFLLMVLFTFHQMLEIQRLQFISLELLKSQIVCLTTLQLFSANNKLNGSDNSYLNLAQLSFFTEQALTVILFLHGTLRSTNRDLLLPSSSQAPTEFLEDSLLQIGLHLTNLSLTTQLSSSN